MPQDAPLETTALFFHKAAQANLQQFEQNIVNERAKATGVEFQIMKYKMMQDSNRSAQPRVTEERGWSPVPRGYRPAVKQPGT